MSSFIAREIYDGPCQYAVAGQMAFARYRRERMKSGSENWDTFDSGLQFLEHTIEELRWLVDGLQPLHRAAGNLPAAIECLIEEISGRTGYGVRSSHSA